MPSITYRITVTEAYLKKAQTNWLAHDPKLRFVSLMLNDKVVWGSRIVIIGAGLFLTLYAGPNFVVIAMFSLVLLGSFVGTYRMKKARSRAARKNAVLSVSMSEDGVSTASQHSNANFQWAAFTRAVAYPEGLVLVREVAGVWLPDQSLIEGTPQGARDMASKKVSEYSVAS